MMFIKPEFYHLFSALLSEIEIAKMIFVVTPESQKPLLRNGFSFPMPGDNTSDNIFSEITVSVKNALPGMAEHFIYSGTVLGRIPKAGGH